jgi:hypothetical protein
MVLAQKQTGRPVEQSRGPRYESTQVCPPVFLTKATKTCAGKKRQPIQQILLGKLNICMQKTETRSMSFTEYKYQLKVDLEL